MKKIIYLILLAVGSVLFNSCTKDFDEVNTNPAQFLTPDAEPAFGSSIRRTVDLMANNNVDYFWEYSHIINKTGRYNSGTDATWQQFWVEILGNLKQLKDLYKDNPGYKNRVNIMDIWECYVYSIMVGSYGPVPYTQALTMSSSIKYDDENSIYISLLERLKTASDGIVLTGDKFSPDILYGGDLTKWKKFANSLRLRIALRCQRNLPAQAQAAVRELMANESMLLSSDADNAKFIYGTVDGSESPYFIRLLKNNNTLPENMPRMSDYAMLYFRPYNDPRMKVYFDPVAVGNQNVITDTLTSTADDTIRVVNYKIPYMGLPKSTGPLPAWSIPGNSPFTGGAVAANQLQAAVLSAQHPFMIMDYAEVCFIKAEAHELGWGGVKTSEQYYLDGINANFNFWGIGNLAAAYQAVNGIKWNTSGTGYVNFLSLVRSDIPANNLAKIWVQRWLNYFPDGGFDAWCLQRQTNNLQLPPHTNPGSAYLNTPYENLPDRWEYPQSAETNNGPAFREALQMLGGTQQQFDAPDIFLKFANNYTRINWSLLKPTYDSRFLQKQYGTTIQGLTANGVAYTVVNKFKL